MISLPACEGRRTDWQRDQHHDTGAILDDQIWCEIIQQAMN